MRDNTLLFDVDDTILDFKAAELAGLTKLFANHRTPGWKNLQIKNDVWIIYQDMIYTPVYKKQVSIRFFQRHAK